MMSKRPHVEREKERNGIALAVKGAVALTPKTTVNAADRTPLSAHVTKPPINPSHNQTAAKAISCSNAH